MNDYFYNNKKMIDWYQQLLDGGLCVSTLLNRFREGSLIQNELIDHSRFRVFIDSCMLLFNKDRLDTDLYRKFSFIDYLKEVNSESLNREITNRVNTFIRFDPAVDMYSIENVSLFYSYDKNNLNPWEQAKIIRNCFAHAHHKNFRCGETGNIYYYDVNNIDKEKNKSEHGFVIEHFIHEWIKKFFSNYPHIGIPYNHAFIIIRSDDLIPYWVTVKISEQYNQKYSGNPIHPLNELSYLMNNWKALENFIKDHPNDLVMIKHPLESVISFEEAEALIEIYQLYPSDYREGELLLQYPLIHYAIKTILAPQIELSNFLTSLSLLNDTIIQAINDIHNTIGLERENSMNRIESSLKELQEDESAVLAFKIGFVLLKAWNIAYRLENRDFTNINYNAVDISGFMYQSDDLSDEPISVYIVERFRNALMHGNIDLKIDCAIGVIIVFEDKFHNNVKTIEIPLTALDSFVQQPAFFEGVLDSDTKYL